ncbi:2-polyprenyl-6-methoxyphenol hydroxylase [Filimonas lacunae]|uniref:2-polyprenyl-6-methoxyphenol hydroxylase n=1 Tax=Filimonas lacunae TaxID=477680 RepID=A0A173MI61_9BACT|nr:FAD binding domain-containing protein [Filimonas lacunae]BAV07313.1 monooxygenase, FAD-binding [Filimonas lacunae]SIS91539.1 2-polyprenyl-6-methoxyphenol hydroxylase [Filimonas lacunae]
MKVIVIGGSIGGLHTGIALLQQGFDVEIYERSAHDLQDRGAGLVIQHDMMEYQMELGISPKALLGVPASRRQILDSKGRAVLTYPNNTVFTSWNYIWRQLKDYFPASRYHFGFEVETLLQTQDDVVVSFRNGQIKTADLVVGADGYGSTVRAFMLPGIQPQYAGYVAYRGLIPESELPAEAVHFFADTFSLYPYDHSHMLSYMVPGPGGELEAGKRLYNWVWYQNKTPEALDKLMTDKNGHRRGYAVPAGLLSANSVEELHKEAALSLPPILADRVVQTDKPFVQVIMDLAVPRMYDGRLVVLGDAAFVVRPHTASGTAKAFRDAIALATDLKDFNTIADALAHWNEHQTRHALALMAHGKQLAAGSRLGG